MKNKPYSQLILASNEDAKNLGITGTPAFFVIGSDGKTTRIFGAQALEKIFEIELKK
jgi:protein-disulfide isomerase